MVNDVSILAAFIAGVVSFTSPCILPIIPIYLTHMAGVSANSDSLAARGVVLRNALAFVAGFGLIFVAFGAALGAVGVLAGSLDLLTTNRSWIVQLGGVILIALGLYQTGLLRIHLLDRERRLSFVPQESGTVSSSFLIGITFGAGWSPCVGPILGVILTMAAGQGSIARATGLLAVYTAGLAIPFLVLALGLGSATGLRQKLDRHSVMLKTVTGAVMIGVGTIMVLGLYEQLFVEIVRNAPWRPWEPNV